MASSHTPKLGARLAQHYLDVALVFGIVILIMYVVSRYLWCRLYHGGHQWEDVEDPHHIPMCRNCGWDNA